MNTSIEAFVSRKRQKPSLAESMEPEDLIPPDRASEDREKDDESTEMKLVILVSLYPYMDQGSLLDLLTTADGSVKSVCKALSSRDHSSSPRKRSAAGIGYQTSLTAFRKPDHGDLGSGIKKSKALTRKGQTLHLYDPEDIAAHTPCSIIHNFLPVQDAGELLKELLIEAPTFEKQTFKLFDTVVQSPHTACFYVESLEEQTRQKTEYLYNGSYLTVGLLKYMTSENKSVR